MRPANSQEPDELGDRSRTSLTDEAANLLPGRFGSVLFKLKALPPVHVVDRVLAYAKATREFARRAYVFLKHQPPEVVPPWVRWPSR